MFVKRFNLCPKLYIQKHVYNWVGGVINKETPDKSIIEYYPWSRESREKVFLGRHDHFQN